MVVRHLEYDHLRKAHLTALGQMFIVTVLWSSSFPIHKALLNGGMPPFSLAAYRYCLASVLLAAFTAYLTNKNRSKTANMPAVVNRPMLSVAILMSIGIGMYSAQAIHMTALSLLPASVSGLISLTWMPIAVALLSLGLNGRLPRPPQMAGMAIVLTGMYVYFPVRFAGISILGILLNILSSSLWAIAVIMTHYAVNRLRLSSLRLTAVSMLLGSFFLLVVALIHDGVYMVNAREAAWLAYLAVVNTALGFALYNHTMKVLGAFEIAVFQDSMIIQIGVLSIIFLGEKMTGGMALGMILVMGGVLVVQFFSPRAVAEEKVKEALPTA